MKVEAEQRLFTTTITVNSFESQFIAEVTKESKVALMVGYSLQAGITIEIGEVEISSSNTKDRLLIYEKKGFPIIFVQ